MDRHRSPSVDVGLPVGSLRKTVPVSDRLTHHLSDVGRHFENGGHHQSPMPLPPSTTPSPDTSPTQKASFDEQVASLSQANQEPPPPAYLKLASGDYPPYDRLAPLGDFPAYDRLTPITVLPQLPSKASSVDPAPPVPSRSTVSTVDDSRPSLPPKPLKPNSVPPIPPKGAQ